MSVINDKGEKVSLRSSDLMKHEGKYIRSPEEQTLRMLGFRSQKEVKASDESYKESRRRSEVQQRVTKLPDKIYDAVRRGDTDDVKDYVRMYIELTGTDRDFLKKMIDERVLREYTTADQKSKLRKDPLEIIKMKKRIENAFAE